MWGTLTRIWDNSTRSQALFQTDCAGLPGCREPTASNSPGDIDVQALPGGRSDRSDVRHCCTVERDCRIFQLAAVWVGFERDSTQSTEPDQRRKRVATGPRLGCGA